MLPVREHARFVSNLCMVVDKTTTLDPLADIENLSTTVHAFHRSAR